MTRVICSKCGWTVETESDPRALPEHTCNPGKRILQLEARIIRLEAEVAAGRALIEEFGERLENFASDLEGGDTIGSAIQHLIRPIKPLNPGEPA